MQRATRIRLLRSTVGRTQRALLEILEDAKALSFVAPEKVRFRYKLVNSGPQLKPAL